jgi:hypothetical protein
MYFNKILFQGCKKRINTLWKDIKQNKNLLVVLAPKNPNDRFYYFTGGLRMGLHSRGKTGR